MHRGSHGEKILNRRRAKGRREFLRVYVHHGTDNRAVSLSGSTIILISTEDGLEQSIKNEQTHRDHDVTVLPLQCGAPRMTICPYFRN